MPWKDRGTGLAACWSSYSSSVPGIPRPSRCSDSCSELPRLGSRRAQQGDELLVKPRQVQIDLDLGWRPHDLRLVGFRPAQRVSKSRAVIEVDIEITGVFGGNQSWFQPSQSRDLVPQIVVLPADPGISADVTRGGSIGFLDLVDQVLGEASLDRNVDGGAHDLFPRCPQRDVRGLGIEPEIEF